MEAKRSERLLAVAGRATLAAATVVVSVPLCEIVIAEAARLSITVALATASTLAHGLFLLGVLCLGTRRLGVLACALLGAGALMVRAPMGDPTGALGPTLFACVTALFAGYFLGSALAARIERPVAMWTVLWGAVVLDVLLHAVPALGRQLRAGRLAAASFILPVPGHSAHSTGAAPSAFGAGIVDMIVLAALISLAFSGRFGPKRLFAAIVVALVVNAAVSVNLLLPGPVTPPLVALLFVFHLHSSTEGEPEALPAGKGAEQDGKEQTHAGQSARSYWSSWTR